MLNKQPGKIHSLRQYLRAKQLDHSGWSEFMPRRITPSDADWVVDNGGYLLFGELSSTTTYWCDLSRGQFKLAQNLVLAGQGKIMSVLCYHRFPIDDEAPVNSITDIISFQLMTYKAGKIMVHPVWPGDHWPIFLRWWKDKRFLKK